MTNRAVVKVTSIDSKRQASEGSLPRIAVTSNPEAIRKIKTAIQEGKLPDLYVANGKPVRIERVSGVPALVGDESIPLPVQATPLTGPLLSSILAHCTTLMMERSGRPVEEWTPPSGVLSAVLAGAEWPKVPTLAGIVGAPFLRRDFSLAQDPGYDVASGTYLAPLVNLPERVPEKPSPKQVKAALKFFDDLLEGFEWADLSGRANYMGVLVTAVLRGALRCLVPLVIISANTASSGKTILTAINGLLVGQYFTSWEGDDVEFKKLITTSFSSPAGVVVFDNAPEGTVIDSPNLAALLTSDTWTDRLMGGNSRSLSFANDRTWMVTGNNLRTGGDIGSRAVMVRLNTKAPHPERRDFGKRDLSNISKRPDFQGKILFHLLILVADWVAAGHPTDSTVPKMRQFSMWAENVGGFLAHHGITGFLGNLEAMQLDDEEDGMWAAFLNQWVKVLGARPVRAGQVFDSAPRRDPVTGVETDPWNGSFLVRKDGSRYRSYQSAQQLGADLAGHNEQSRGDPGIRVRRVKNSHSGRPEWVIENYIDKDWYPAK